MLTSIIPDETLVTRLSLPLAQLYRRAHNAKSPLERHLTAFYLWEASLKLLGAVCVVKYAGLGQPDVELAGCLQNLARPSLGHWWEFIRRLLPVLAGHRPEFLMLREALLGKARDDLPRSAGLDVALREALEGKTGARATVYPAELFDRLVQYRNKEIGHGAAGQRSAEAYDRIGTSLLLAAGELLARFDILAGRGLWFLPDIRQVQGRWLVERFELSGEAARRLESWSLPREAATTLPDAGQIHLAQPMATNVSGLVKVHPLLVYDAEANEGAFLNARRGKSGTEYLCYTTGQTSVRPDLGSEQRKLLARALGMAQVTEDQARAWADKSTAEEGPIPAAVVGPRRLGEYELFSELGRGGMGIVYRAWQPSLGRQVALKCLAQSGDPKAEARFRREIRALGRVEHPHVVKVFASGADGEQWFYVMELVEGVPLSAVCDKLATSVTSVTEVDVPTWQAALKTACTEAREKEKPLSDKSPIPEAGHGGQPLEITSRLRGRPDYVARVVDLMRQTAEAAHAMHERGIIHRDIKPGNIMLSPDGVRATLMDLGLAQLADDVEGRLTRTRQFVGTLRYASPQQVLAVGHLDRRSDIYSLGATLWELLALKPLFGATEDTPTPELMEKIQRQEPERLRHAHPGLSRNLEAVVHKCLEKSAERRYLTAHDLAEDLRRVQEGEPVKARPVGRVDRTIKWTRRHPAQAAALTLLLCMVAALAAGFVLVNDERSRTDKANADLTDTNARLVAEKARTRQALDAMTSEVMDDLLARQRELTENQKVFLKNALASYLSFAQETGTDEQTRAGVAGAYLRAGNIQRRLGMVEAAEDAYRRSGQWYAQLAADFPGMPEYRSDAAKNCNNLGSLLLKMGHTREAEAQLRAALAIRKQLAADFPTVPEYRSDLAGSHNNLGILLRSTEHSGDAKNEYRAALEIREQLAAEFPTVPAYRSDLATSHINLGNLLRRTGPLQDAEREYRTGVAIQMQLAADFPKVAAYRSDLARNHFDLALLLSDTGHSQEAATEFRAALAIQRRFAAEFPTVPEYRLALARSHNELGYLLTHSGHPRQAETEYRAGLVIQKQLAADFPSVPDYRRSLASAQIDLGALLKRTGRPKEAEAEYRAALATQKQVAADFPTVVVNRRDLAGSHYMLGNLLSQTGRPQEATTEYRAALAIQEQLVADFPAMHGYRSDVARTHGSLGNPLLNTGHPEEAVREYRTALTILKQLIADSPTVPEYRTDLAEFQNNLGVLLMKTGHSRQAERELRDALATSVDLVSHYTNAPDYQNDLAESMVHLAMLLRTRKQFAGARRLLEDALPHQIAALQGSPHNPTYRACYRENIVELGDTLVRLCLHVNAAKTADQLMLLAVNPAEDGYNASCILAECRALAEKDSKLSPGERKVLAKVYADRAMAALQKAVAAGYRDVKHLQEDHDLDALRDRSDFKKLISSLEPASRPRNPTMKPRK